ncbi:TPA: hypothetical protein ACKRTE_003256 [Providencia rettgeri]
MCINTSNRNVNNSVFKRSIALDIIENYFPFIKKINNITLNNFIHLFSFNEKNKSDERPKFYVKLKEIHPQKSESNLCIKSNQIKIISLENELLKKSFEISSTVKTIKNDINNSIINASKIDKFYVEELVNNKIIKKQNELIDYYTYHIHNVKLIEDKDQLKNDINELKSEIKSESKKLGVSYLEKKHEILESSYKEIENTFEIEDQNEMLKSLIYLQTSIKNLLTIELDDVKSKMHNITSGNYSWKSINPKKNKISKKLTDEKKSETQEEPIIKKNLITYDEDNTPIYHDESHQFDYDDFMEKKPEIESEYVSVMIEDVVDENIELYKSITELSYDNQDYRKLVQDLRVDNNEKNQKILRLQKKLINIKKSMDMMGPTSRSSDYHSNIQETSLIQNIKVNKETNEKKEIVAPKKRDTNISLSRKKIAKKYSYTHKVQCLSAGIATTSTPEELKQKQEQINAKRELKKP